MSVAKRLACSCVVAALFGCATPPEETNCDLSRPPKDSGYDVVQGAFAFVYPQAVGPDYYGCQTMWGQDGKKWLVLRVAKGKPTALSIDAPDGTREQCAYDENGLAQGDPKLCLSVAAFRSRNGLGSMPITSAVKIPREADIRDK